MNCIYVIYFTITGQILMVMFVEIVMLVPVKFVSLVFYEEFNPDETNKKVSLGKRDKFGWVISQL